MTNRPAASPPWVLDVDLDFFLSDCCPMAEPGQRPPAGSCPPWPEDHVRAFLEENCRLSAARPAPGAVFETHDRALDFWQAMLEAGRLGAPFRVVHVDAHSDLGIAPPRAAFVEASVLCRPPDRRCDIPRYRRENHLTEANYLLFALAFRWIGRLDNVRNPMSRPDMPPGLLIPGDGGPALRLRQSFPGLFDTLYGPEPSVPYAEYADYRAFSADCPPEFFTLAMSPRYAPPEADLLADIIREYIIGE